MVHFAPSFLRILLVLFALGMPLLTSIRRAADGKIPVVQRLRPLGPANGFAGLPSAGEFRSAARHNEVHLPWLRWFIRRL